MVNSERGLAGSGVAAVQANVAAPGRCEGKNNRPASFQNISRPLAYLGVCKWLCYRHCEMPRISAENSPSFLRGIC